MHSSRTHGVKRPPSPTHARGGAGTDLYESNIDARPFAISWCVVLAEARQVITSIIPHLGVISSAGDSGAVAGTESSAKRALDLITECEGLLLKCDASHTKVGHERTC